MELAQLSREQIRQLQAFGLVGLVQQPDLKSGDIFFANPVLYVVVRHALHALKSEGGAAELLLQPLTLSRPRESRWS